MAEMPESVTIQLDIRPRWRAVVVLAVLVFAISLFASLLGVFVADALLRMGL